MKIEIKRIPIIAAAAFISLMTSGCGEKIGSNALSPSETTAAQTTATTTTATTTTTTTPRTTTTTKTTTITTTDITEETETEETEAAGLLSSADDLELTDLNGEDWDFEFVYGDRTFEAIYTAYSERWTIKDSYLIHNRDDMKIICEALIEIHPIHGRDYVSYRTPEDMVYEWGQHNLAYNVLPDNNRWRDHARDVDFDPEDQGRSLYDMFMARKG